MVAGGAAHRARWMVALRWWAAAVVITGAALAEGLGFPLPTRWLVATGGAMLSYNLIVLTAIRRGTPAQPINVIQMTLDLMALTVLVFLSGGVENPLLVYFVFHLVIAGMTLPRPGVYAAATAVFTVVALAAVLTYYRVIPHVHLWGTDTTLHRNPIYVLTVLAAWGSTLFLLAYVASSLRREIDDKQVQLVRANERLQDQDAMKSRYVLTVSHDLKSPLASVLNCVDVARSGLAGGMPDRARVLLDRAAGNCQLVLRLIDDLLLLSRIRTTTEDVRWASPGEVAEGVRDELDALAGEAGVEIVWDVPGALPPARGIDARALDHVVRNLVENAVRYTDTGGRVRVSAWLEGDGVAIQVEDTGIGISQEEMPHVFDEFFRGPRARRRTSQGTGLGLTIVNELVRRGGGHVSVASQEGAGTTFVIYLPASKGGLAGEKADRRRDGGVGHHHSARRLRDQG